MTDKVKDRRIGSACEYCGGTGSVRVHSHQDYGVSFECEWCEHCEEGLSRICEDVGHEYAGAGGGLLICMRCQAEDWDD